MDSLVDLTNLADTLPRKHRVACITTNSLREVLDLFKMDDQEFPYGITRINASASDIEDPEPTYNNKELGINVLIGKKTNSFNIRYLIDFDDDGNVKNPIDEFGKREILKSLDISGCEDASVSLVNVIVKDQEIGNYSEINEDLFHLTIVSDPIDDSKDRAMVREHHVNESLIKYNSFKYRILHCREAIDRKQELTKPKSRQKYIVYWRGNTALSLNSPIKLAQRIKSHFGKYGLLKQYGVTEELNLILLSVAR